jgi:type I restriction enzyme R subunit
MAISIDDAVTSRKIRDWSDNVDIVNEMKNDIEDVLYDASESSGVTFPGEVIDAVIDKLTLVAKRRDLA